ncbi:hypothetical protein HG536_0D00650 [Torulaspora globosa]|uniref:Serine/threonine-protein phosphatase 4 regulatory subunit 3 n=1 Tax=Torulaspora globosa TaxID=48254 RepID=A0A7G3ZGA7_9SACH|nr:uncharacterized protein HG536_0D00650 [Torulaspora globosa]QLL32543.1 hypothetical protein HG536_0D00650 [Torulaspora globosa]
MSRANGLDGGVSSRGETVVRDTEPRRVKAYVLENNEWKDTGTGFCIGKVDGEDGEGGSRGAFLVVTNEEASREVLLRSRLEGNIEYQRQEETLIVWKDLTGKDIALSFEESIGCDALCDFIVEVQRNLESNISLVAVKSNESGIGSVHEIITGPVSLPSSDPKQDEKTLMSALRILNENIAFEFLKNETVEFVLESNYIGVLINHFHKAEAEKLPRDLLLLGSLVKTLILYNQRDILEKMTDDENIVGIVGILEYDTDFPGSKANHRKCLEAYNPTIKEVIPIPNEELKDIVKKCFRLQFLKDVVLVRFLDDHNNSFILEIILDLQTCIIDFIKVGPFLDTLFALYDERAAEEVDETLIEKRRDGIRLLHQCVQTSKNLDMGDKENFYRTLIKKNLFKVLDYAFHKERESNLRILATDTIVTIIEYDILLISNVQRNDRSLHELDESNGGVVLDSMNDVAQGKTESFDVSLLLILSTILLTDKSPGMREQVSQALNTLLHPEGCCPGASPGDGHNGNMDLMPDSNYETHVGCNGSMMNGDGSYTDFRMTECFTEFYSRVAPILFKPLMGAKVQSVNDENLLIHLVKLVSFICTEHNRRMSREFILENQILESVSQLIEPCHSLQLRLTAVRCFKNIMCLDDEYYHRHMISNKLYGPIFSLLQENLNKDNLANSCVQDFCKIILVHCLATRMDVDGQQQASYRKSNFTLLNKHLFQDYGETIHRANHIRVFNELIEFYEEQSAFEDGKIDDKEDISMDSNGNGNSHVALDDENKAFKRLRSEPDILPDEQHESFVNNNVNFKKVIDKLNTVEPPSAMLGELMRK